MSLAAGRMPFVFFALPVIVGYAVSPGFHFSAVRSPQAGTCELTPSGSFDIPTLQAGPPGPALELGRTSEIRHFIGQAGGTGMVTVTAVRTSAVSLGTAGSRELLIFHLELKLTLMGESTRAHLLRVVSHAFPTGLEAFLDRFGNLPVAGMTAPNACLAEDILTISDLVILVESVVGPLQSCSVTAGVEDFTCAVP